MAQSQVDIGNRSLLGIGAQATISSISPSDGSTEADAIAILFSPTFEALARTAYWNCLRKQATLTLLQAAQGTPENPNGTTLPLPPTPWLYAYTYPSDCLAFRFIVPSLPSTGVGGIPLTTINNAAGINLPTPSIPFVIAYGQDDLGNPQIVVLTNQSEAQGVYTVNQQNPNFWDPLFQQAMVNALGAFLVPALSLSIPLLDRAVAAAERLIGQARAADGNEGVTVMDHLPDWIRARGGGGEWCWNAQQAFAYSAMPWPTGA